jgi:hypothetical protein
VIFQRSLAFAIRARHSAPCVAGLSNNMRARGRNSMSSKEDEGISIDLESLFQPDWAKKPADQSRYSNYTGKEEVSRGRRGGGGRQDDRRGGRPQRPQGGSRGGDRGGPRRDDRGGGGGAPRGARSDDRGRSQGGDRRGGGRPDRREPEEQLPEVDVMIVPAGKIVDSLAKQIRLTGMAYPLFDIAALVVAKPERFGVRYSVARRADGSPVCPLFLCDLDKTLFTSMDDAVRHVLRKHFDMFYQAGRIPIDPPKGNYTFVAQCGLSGKVLGPPNFHDYQNQLRKLHADRYSSMPFDRFKDKVKIVRDEEIVKQWLEDQSFKTEYVCLNVPEELKLPSREAVEQHFREIHLENIIKPVKSHVITSSALTEQPNRAIKELYRRTFSQQQRFPIKVVHELSQQFSSKGLQFFKVNKSVTHVAVARPRFLDFETTPVADAIRRTLEFINATPGCNRRSLLEALAPVEVAAAVDASVNEAEAPKAEATDAEAPALPDGKVARLLPAAQAIHDDLHWLIHEGHVIEFASGALETAKAPKNPQARDAAEAYEKKRKRHPGQAKKRRDSRDSTATPPETKGGEAEPNAAPASDSSTEEPVGASALDHASKPAEAVDSAPAAPEDQAANSTDETTDSQSEPEPANPVEAGTPTGEEEAPATVTDVEPEAVVNTDETPDPTIESSSDDGVKNDAAAPASAKVEPSPEEIEPASDPAKPAST